MQLFITGGTGLIGSSLIPELKKKGHQITVLTRNKNKARKKLGSEIQYCTSLDYLDSLDGYDGVINLAGEPIIGKRWTKKQKKRIENSRWNTTRRLTQLIKNGNHPPQVFLSGSAVGYYGVHNDTLLNEESTPRNDFLHRVCLEWEQLAFEASKQTRVCVFRTGIVLSRKGGMIPPLLIPFQLGLGAVLGSGKQYLSWIHIQDMVQAIIFLLENKKAQGTFNFTTPYPVTHKEFSKKLAKTLSRPCFFRIPSFLIRWVLGEQSTMVLEGQRVIPQKLLRAQFSFMYEQIDEALYHLIQGEKEI